MTLSKSERERGREKETDCRVTSIIVTNKPRVAGMLSKRKKNQQHSHTQNDDHNHSTPIQAAAHPLVCSWFDSANIFLLTSSHELFCPKVTTGANNKERRHVGGGPNRIINGRTARKCQDEIRVMVLVGRGGLCSCHGCSAPFFVCPLWPFCTWWP